jgi:hypothetical protein
MGAVGWLVMLRKLVDQELVTRKQSPLTHDEFLALLPHEGWSVETCANMILQLRRSRSRQR